MAWIVVAVTVSALVALQALYVAAEFATVSARRTRLAQLAHEGDRLARQVLAVTEDPRHLDRYIAACQVGITTSNLVLGFYGQARLTPVLVPALTDLGITTPSAAPTLATTVVLLALTALQVVLGELVPKNVGVQYPERLALVTAVPMRWSMALFRPLIALFNGSGRLVLDALGRASEDAQLHVHRPEEILMLVAESGAGGLIDPEERRLIENTLRWRDLTARQAMVARIRLLAAPVDLPRQEMLARLAGSPHSRLVLYDGSIDNIVGIVHLKELMCPGPGPWDARRALRPVPFVPETAPVAEVFARLQRASQPLAIVLDEYGGTAGMLSVDDVVAAIFGDVRDEFDTELPPIQPVTADRVLVRGDTRIDELNEWFNLFLSADEANTIGGLVLTRLDRVPRPGDQVALGDAWLRVERMDGKAVVAVSMPVSPEQMARWRERGA